MSETRKLKIELAADVYEKLVKDAGKGHFAKHISKLIIAYEPEFGSDKGLQATIQDILVRLAKLEAKDVHANKTQQSIDIPEFDFDATLAAMSALEVEPSDDEEESEQQPDTSSIQDEWEAYQAEHVIEPTLSRCSERKNRLSSAACLTVSRSFRGGWSNGTGAR